MYLPSSAALGHATGHCTPQSGVWHKVLTVQKDEEKITQAAKKPHILTSIKEKGPLEKKSPLTREEESSQ